MLLPIVMIALFVGLGVLIPSRLTTTPIEHQEAYNFAKKYTA